MFENCKIFAGFPMALEVWNCWMAAELVIGCNSMPFVYTIFTLRDWLYKAMPFLYTILPLHTILIPHYLGKNEVFKIKVTFLSI